MFLLRLRDIHKRFGPTVALEGVNLELRPAEVHALIGENGAGKSTLMRIIAGDLEPDRGAMELEGASYRPASPLDARRAGIAFIHQELSLCSHLSVWENILMGIEPQRRGWLDGEACRRRTLEVLENFSHPDVNPDRPVGELSVAARQVVEICRALAFEARIILMDEPTSSLERSEAARLFALIRRLRERGVSVIYISHFLEEVREVADRYTVLRDGQSVAAGNLVSAADDDLIAAMVGRPVSNIFPQRPGREPGETLLQVDNLVSLPSLKEASFELRRGQILGVAGLMGAGRTQMVRALFGLEPAQSGTLLVGSRVLDARRAAPVSRIGAGLGYVSEDRTQEGLALELSVADNITMTRYSSCSRWGWIDGSVQQEQALRRIRELAVRAEGAFQAARTLSGGNQQKLALARLLHQDAEVFLLDEPTRGIDIASKAQIYQIISRLAEAGKGILLVSSYLPELFGLCDRLAVMSRGRLSEPRPVGDWTPEAVLQAALGRNH